MRRHLLQCMRKENIPVEEGQLEAEDVLEAQELFLSNGIYGIRWVKQLGDNNYTNQLSSMLYRKFVQSLW